MNDMTPIAIRLTPERAKTLLEAAGADAVHVKINGKRSMWAFFTYFEQGFVWILRYGAFERNFAKDVEREFRAANERVI